MKIRIAPFVLVSAGMTVSCAMAQGLSAPVKASQHRIGLSGRLGFNLQADFKNLGGFPAQRDSGPATGNADHVYDDGYNLRDGRGVNDGETWAWEYSNAGQVPGNGTVVMTSSSSASDLSVNGVEEGPQPGFELSYGRELGTFGRVRWGLETAFGYDRVEISDDRGLSGTVTRISHAYAFAGALPPGADHRPPGEENSAFGDPVRNTPGPLLSDIPIASTTTIPGGALVVGKRDLDASLFGFRLGPYFDVPLSRRFSVSLHAGFAVAHVDSDFSFSESVTIPSMGPALQPGVSNTQNRSGFGSDNEWRPGGYAGLRLNFLVTERWSLFAGGDYQHLGRFSQTVGGKRAELDLGQTLLATGGVNFRF